MSLDITFVVIKDERTIKNVCEISVRTFADTQARFIRHSRWQTSWLKHENRVNNFCDKNRLLIIAECETPWDENHAGSNDTSPIDENGFAINTKLLRNVTRESVKCAFIRVFVLLHDTTI